MKHLAVSRVLYFGVSFTEQRLQPFPMLSSRVAPGLTAIGTSSTKRMRRSGRLSFSSKILLVVVFICASYGMARLTPYSRSTKFLAANSLLGAREFEPLLGRVRLGLRRELEKDLQMAGLGACWHIVVRSK